MTEKFIEKIPTPKDPYQRLKSYDRFDYMAESMTELEKVFKLLEFNQTNYKFLKERNCPVTARNRIEMDAFKNIYPETLNQDAEKIIERIKALEEKEKRPILGKELLREGEQFEVVKNFILNKYLEPEYISVRTSIYDDLENKVDNLILSRKTFNVVCAVDEVTDPIRKSEKMKIIEEKNATQGGEVKYGFRFLKDRVKLLERGVSHLPIFWLYVDSPILKNALREVNPNFEQKNEFEKNLIKLMLNEICQQLPEIKISPDPVLRSQAKNFEKALKENFEELMPPKEILELEGLKRFNELEKKEKELRKFLEEPEKEK